MEDEDEEAEGAAGAAGAAVVCEPVAEAEAEAEAPGAAAVQAAAVQVAAVQVAEAEAGPMTADDVAESGGRGDGTAAAGAATTGAAATVPCGICGGAAPSPAEKLRRRRRRDLYPHESILVHEFAHCVMDVGLDDESRERIRAAHNAALDRATVSAESYMGSNASEYWAEATQAWFEASVRCDVNCGLNTRAELARCDPAIAAELERAFGPNDWRYPHTLARVAPRRGMGAPRRGGGEAARPVVARGAAGVHVPPRAGRGLAALQARRQAKPLSSHFRSHHRHFRGH